MKLTASDQKVQRPILKAMIDEGFDNYIMYPVVETTIGNHRFMEEKFIMDWNTINSGYNVQILGCALAELMIRARFLDTCPYRVSSTDVLLVVGFILDAVDIPIWESAFLNLVLLGK
jgi:hypothetical protein